MKMKAAVKLVREGDLLADVTVRLRDDAGAWSPALTLEDARKLDEVRRALRSGDLQRASQLSDHVYRLTPLAS
jgi:hypothetical protein